MGNSDPVRPESVTTTDAEVSRPGSSGDNKRKNNESLESRGEIGKFRKQMEKQRTFRKHVGTNNESLEKPHGELGKVWKTNGNTTKVLISRGNIGKASKTNGNTTKV